MTTQRTSLFGCFLKTVLVLIGLALTAVLVLNGWSWWDLKQARTSFEEAIGDQETEVAAPKPAFGLIAVSKIGEGIEWTKDERIAVSTASSLACQDWTPEQFETVQLVVERNNGLKAAVLDALRVPHRSLEAPEADQKILGSMINLVRLLTADARLALVDGNHKRFLRALVVLVTLELEFEANPNPTNHILNTAIRNLCNRTLLDSLSGDNPDILDTAFLKQCQAALPVAQVTDSLRSTFIRDLARTRHSFLENCQSTPDGGLIKVLIHPIVTPIFCRFSEAAMIEQQMMLIDLIDRPFGLQPEAFKQPPRPPLWKVHRLLASVALPNLMSTVGRTQAIAAQRQLLNAALTMRATQWPDGAYPETRPDLPALSQPDPFSGQLLEYRQLDNGRLHLAIADGPKLLKALKRPGPQTWLDPVVLEPPAPE